jgi:hypothetical protein
MMPIAGVIRGRTKNLRIFFILFTLHRKDAVKYMFNVYCLQCRHIGLQYTCKGPLKKVQVVLTKHIGYLYGKTIGYIIWKNNHSI